MVDTQGHAIPVRKLGEDGLFFCGWRIFSDYPHTAIAVTNDIMVGEKFHRAGENAAKKSFVRMSPISAGVSAFGFRLNIE